MLQYKDCRQLMTDTVNKTRIFGKGTMPLLCVVLNFGLNKLPMPIIVTNSIVSLHNVFCICP